MTSMTRFTGLLLVTVFGAGIAPAEAQTVPQPAALGDTVLQRLMGQALLGNRGIQAARARVNAARAIRVGAALDLAPAVTAAGGYSRQRLAGATFPGAAGAFPDQDVWDAGMQLSWEVDLYGRMRRSLQGQGAMVASAQEDVRDAQVLLSAELATAWFELRGAQDRLATAQQNAENQRHTLALTQERLAAGRGTAFDSERARAQLSSTLAVIPALQAAIAAQQYRIAVLVGRPSAEVIPELAAAGPLPVLPASVEVAIPDALIRERPDVRSAERQVAARSALSGAARADYLPRLTIGGAAGYSATTVGSLGNTGTMRYAIGPTLSWPALNLGRVHASVDAARANETEARANYELATQRAVAEIETALAGYRGAHERLALLDDAAAASERAALLARLRFQEGAADFLSVLDAERTLLEAQDRRAQGRTDALTALISVYRSLGGRLPEAAAGTN